MTTVLCNIPMTEGQLVTSYPTHWSDFEKSVGPQGWRGDTNPHGTFSRFSARYRAAQSYAGASFPDHSDEIANAYSAMIGVGLAYSALESLARAEAHVPGQGQPSNQAIGEMARTFSVLDSQLALDFRTRPYFAKQLIRFTNKQLAARILQCQEGDDDLRPVAEGVRHLAFHGVLSPGTAGGTRISVFFEELRKATLRTTDQEFTRWFTAHQTDER